MAPDISIVIPTYNRHAALKTALESVAACRTPSSGVLVVDQSHDAGQKADSFKKQFPFVTYVAERAANLPNARNIGIMKSSAEIVLFMDDDAVMLPGCIEEHLASHQRPGVGVVAGRIRQEGSGEWDKTDTVTAIDPQTSMTRSNFDLDWEGEVLYTTGGNFSIKRAVVQKAGGFNCRLRGNAYFEDIEFSSGAKKQGTAIWYNPRAVVVHRPLTQGGCANQNQTAYLLDRLHNHTLFYLLHIRRIPTPAYIRYQKNLVEFISRTGNGRHSLWRIMQCAFAFMVAYINMAATVVSPPRIL